MSECPKTDRLRSLLDGQLADAEQSELQQHIDSCERCQQTLENLVAGKESWDGIARRLGDGETPVTPALHDAIAAAKEMEATIPSAKLPPGFLQPSEQSGSLGRLAHYEVLQEVGSGGMGVVLKAFDTSLRRVIAIKVMAPHLATNSAARRRFVREAQAAAAVAHEHVVAIHAVADQHEPPYLAMQFIEGKTLQERIDAAGPLSVREVLRIGMQTAAGLAAAHAQGLVHRDIKPANILLENGVERVKLTDFGLARAVDDASMTQSGVIAGTPLFMSPEQARGDSIDHRSDLFSLGSVLYAMCVGHAPFRASTTMGVIKRVCDESPRPIREVNPEVPDWLVKLIDKLLSKRREDRFQSAQEVASLLGQCLAHWQQPQTSSLPRELGVAPSQSSPLPITANISEMQRPLKLLTLSVLGLWVALMILRALRLMTWQNFLFASYLLGPSLLVTVVVGWFIALRRRKHSASGAESLLQGWRSRWADAKQGEQPKSDSSKSSGTSIVHRTRIGVFMGLLGGLATIGWLVQPVPGLAGVWLGHVCEATLSLMGMLLLLAGVFAGWHHGVRKLPRNFGSILRGLGFAAICLTLLAFMTDNLAARWKSWQYECSIRFQGTRPEDAQLQFLIYADHSSEARHQYLLGGVPLGGTIPQLAPGPVNLIVMRANTVVYSERLTLFPGQNFTWAVHPPSLDEFAKLQGRWQIVEAKGNVALPADAGFNADWWIEFSEDQMRVSDAVRSGVLLPGNLRFGIGPNSVRHSFDLIGHANGVYKLDGDTLVIGLSNPGERPPSTSDPSEAVTRLVCRRMTKS